MQIEPTVVSVEIVHPSMGESTVTAKFSDSTERVVLRYYRDEVSYTHDEFVGKTAGEVSDMHFRKDSAYLRS
jgi:hypothetical protein